ncbi:MAG: hypothetical protein GWN55_05245 [Phycisphaerae bacterium]|nr:CRTAC1 family protein [candidate division KSB1 bacterium]NIV00722.1 hypothetical protein [Phycisphaerae bacterium]NIR71199.1 CRTAC1 family protein [candidate division KSB1 bacterium]NIT71231.1 CRTAC1 family protein [candidate division KSB1 bacterium]NIU24935.1 CRTAC1 family protein [candidate division KSB1 bacterium]
MRHVLTLSITIITSTFPWLPPKDPRVGVVYPPVKWLLFAWLVTALSACSQDEVSLRFTDVAETSGLQFRHNFGAEKPRNLLMTTGSGCALFDYDNDGWLDAFLVNATKLDESGLPLAEAATHHALFHNKGDGTFENVTKAAQITRATYGQGCAVADFDGDGFTDLYVTNFGPNQLYRNRGDGTFQDVTERSGTGDPRWSTGAVFFDHDNDGDLDLFVANYVKFPIEHHSWTEPKLRGPRFYDAEEDMLYRNNGDGTFTDVSSEVGLISGGKGLAVVAADFDNDGDQDLFIANDRTPNFLYQNNDGQFTEIGLKAGIAVDQKGVDTAGMGVDIADLNGDGKQDIYVTNFHYELNNLYENLGDLLFADMAEAMCLDENNWISTGWATRFVDFNNDGYLDCFVANGGIWAYRKPLAYGVTYPQKNLIFVGNQEGCFKDVAGECGKDFQKKLVSRGAAFGDYDNDGDIDILVSNCGGPAQLLRNDIPVSDRWLRIRLKGQPPNINGIGAKVITRLGNRTVSSETRFAGAYLGSSDPTLHIGLRPGESEGSVEVTWPSGKTTTRKVRAGTLTLIEEPRYIALSNLENTSKKDEEAKAKVRDNLK